MNDSIFDDSIGDARAVIDEVVAKADVLPTTEAEFVGAIEAIEDALRGLFTAVTSTKLETVQEWIALLNDIPKKIGIRSEFSEAAQERIEQVREVIANKLDFTWPELAGTALCDGDSGINLGIGSGILWN